MGSAQSASRPCSALYTLSPRDTAAAPMRMSTITSLN